MEKLIDKFIRYVKIETTSDESQEVKQPSSDKEFDLAKLLKKELEDMGLNVALSEYGYVYAKIDSNIDGKPALCFIAHMDTSPDASGKNVNPKIWEDYQGDDLYLNDNMLLLFDDNPVLSKSIGKTIITTDGTTLLGADDKAGISEIMCMAEYVTQNKDFKHGDIYIVFTPDEEIGRGTDNFDFNLCRADYGYTVDGGSLGELEYENFNAASMTIEVHGKTIHPGDAKNKMKNAIRIFEEFDSMLPSEQKPEYTDGYEGFFHVHDASGSVDYYKADYLIREHDKTLFESKKQLANTVADFINKKYGENTVKVTIKDSYYNMGEIIKNNFHLILNAKKAMENTGVKPNVVPIRGGTDGARLSYMNLPCANLSTGGQNYHSVYEFAIKEDMEKMVEVILEIIRIYAGE